MNSQFTLNGTIIETQRLILRPFCQADLQDFYDYASQKGVGERAGWPHHKSIEESQRIMSNFIAEDKTFAIVLKTTNTVIGSLGVEKYELEDKLTEFDGYSGREIGFVLSRDHWGKGLMTEAVKGVVSYLFDVKNLDFILCGHYDFNVQSKRVQQKCGFVPYRKLVMETRMGTKEPGVLNLLLNPSKHLQLNFSHPETLIYACANGSKN